MAIVVMESWKVGLMKVSLTKLQVEKLNISLKESKDNVDSLLNGEQIALEIEDVNLAEEFFKEAERLGVNCKLTIK